MFQRRFLSALFAALLILVFACGGDDAPAVPTVVPAATPVPLPTVVPPPPFSASDYTNGDEVKQLLNGLGPERSFPPELMDGAPVLANNEAAGLWEGFLMNTRTIEVKRDLVLGIGRITSVSDNCGGTGEFNTFTILYSPPDGYYEGASGIWDAIHDEFSLWNRPRWMNPTGAQEWRVFVSRGLAAVTGPTLSPPASDGIATVAGGLEGVRELRVFDHPECEEVEPAQSLAPDVWQLLGYDSIRPLPPELSADAPQMSPEDVVAVHRESTLR